MDGNGTTNGDLVVRAATAGDMDAVALIYRPAVVEGTASFELEAPDVVEMTRRWAAITGAGYPYLVAEIGGAVAAFAYANTFRARPAFRATVENSIYVAAGLQGRGIGRTLLTALIDACTAAGFRQMIGVIGDSSRQAASLKLHAACGFVEAGRLSGVGNKQGRWLDIVFVQRPLGAGESVPPPA